MRHQENIAHEGQCQGLDCTELKHGLMEVVSNPQPGEWVDVAALGKQRHAALKQKNSQNEKRS